MSAKLCGNTQSFPDTGNIEVWNRAWGHQHRSPVSHTGLSNGVESIGKKGWLRRHGHEAENQEMGPGKKGGKGAEGKGSQCMA